jgi:hypothetical protein
VISIQVAWLDADQPHSRERLTDTLPVPPAGPKEVCDPLTVGWHRPEDVGAVTSVLVELPQPTVAAAANTNARAGCERRVTACR